mmetsp:Transcript_62426/g.190907  ORF Transcript_62426/g.190907 Transcript_62426/m.190907 type:complete len:201 (+) Transcript_62426:262-864(+)
MQRLPAPARALPVLPHGVQAHRGPRGGARGAPHHHLRHRPAPAELPLHVLRHARRDRHGRRLGRRRGHRDLAPGRRLQDRRIRAGDPDALQQLQQEEWAHRQAERPHDDGPDEEARDGHDEHQRRPPPPRHDGYPPERDQWDLPGGVCTCVGWANHRPGLRHARASVGQSGGVRALATPVCGCSVPAHRGRREYAVLQLQ